MLNPLKRIKDYLDYKGIKISSFEKSVGLSNGSFGGQLKKNRTIGIDKLENILKTYPDLNADWVLTGRGDMLGGKHDPVQTQPSLTNALSLNQLNYERTIESLNQVIVAQQKTIAALEKLMEMSALVNQSQSGTQTH
ncbi:SlyX family protein [Parapedobacter sp. GCM10030251]|uniref:SlyX family protein n=1 Tax=Parapedobacter sp. GCM10030251 TaxID=3273419 RepID=UPI00361C9C45